MYNSRVKNRKIKKMAGNFANLMKFKTTNFSFSSKLTFVGVFLGIIAISINWITNNSIINTGAFNRVTGVNAFFILLSLFLSGFIIFSTNKKEKIKMFLNISFKDSEVLKKLGALIIILSISSLYNVIGLSTFSAEIEYGKGIILSIISGMIIFYSGHITKKEDLDNNRVYFQDIEYDALAKQKEHNMKLPF